MDIEDELKVVGQNQQTLEVRILIGNFGQIDFWNTFDEYFVKGFVNTLSR